MSLFSKPEKDALILILDVQSSMVRGSLALIQVGKPIRIVFTYTKSIPYKPHAGSSYLIKSAIRAVRENVDAALQFVKSRKAEEGVPRHIESVHYALCSPWIISQAKHVSMSFPNDTEITKARVMDIIEKERARLAPKDDAQVEAIEEKIFDVRLNGYSVASWQNKRAKELEVSYVVSVAGTNMVGHLRRECEIAVNAKKIFFHSSLLLQHIGIQAVMPKRAAYALIHIHAELTDVVLVERHSCVFFGSYPMGIQTIVRKIAHGTGTDEKTADSLLALHLGQSLAAGAQERYSKTIAEISKGWSSELTKLFKKEDPAQNPFHEAMISARIHRDFFNASLKAAYPGVLVENIDMPDVAPHVVLEPHIDHALLTSLYAIAIHNMQRE